jgi:uncharacterized protein YdhG (YjbR/CyaY superfamily)
MTAAPTPPSTVDEYVDSLDGDAQRIAIRFREIILRAAPGITEAVRYKMPCFLVDGEYLVYFGAWKNHIGLYPIPRLGNDLEAEIDAYRSAKDTVQFRYKDPVPWDLVERLIGELVRRLTVVERPTSVE